MPHTLYIVPDLSSASGGFEACTYLSARPAARETDCYVCIYILLRERSLRVHSVALIMRPACTGPRTDREIGVRASTETLRHRRSRYPVGELARSSSRTRSKPDSSRTLSKTADKLLRSDRRPCGADETRARPVSLDNNACVCSVCVLMSGYARDFFRSLREPSAPKRIAKHFSVFMERIVPILMTMLPLPFLLLQHSSRPVPFISHAHAVALADVCVPFVHTRAGTSLGISHLSKTARPRRASPCVPPRRWRERALIPLIINAMLVEQSGAKRNGQM